MRNLFITGSQDAGTEILANLLAKGAVCDEYNEIGACGECRFCQAEPYSPAQGKITGNKGYARLDGRGLTVEKIKEFRQPLYNLHSRRIRIDGKLKILPVLLVIHLAHLDEVPTETQDYLLRHYMESDRRANWIVTAEDATKVSSGIVAFLEMEILLERPRLDELVGLLCEHCRKVGIVHRPECILYLAQRTGGVVASAVKILDYAQLQKKRLTEALIEECLRFQEQPKTLQ